MKGKQLRKALALIGGFVGSGAMVTGPAYATWAFNQTASKTGTANVSVGREINTPLISVSGGWLNQTVLFENNDGYIDGTLHYSGYTSGSVDVTATQGDDNVYSAALGHVGAATYSYSAYMTSPNAWPSQTATQTFSMPSPNNNMTCSITSPTGHYHVGETVSFVYTYTEASNPDVLAGIASSVYANFIWTTNSTDTNVDNGWSWELSGFTHSGTTWTRTDSNTIDSNATYYIRCQIQDTLTGLSSDWKTIATISPVYTAANIGTSWSTSWAIPSTNTSSYALANKATVSFNYSDCGAYYTYYYYSTTNSKPAIPSSFYSGYQGSWTRSGATNSSFVIENLVSANQTYYWWIWAACTTTGTSTYSSAKSGTVSLSASVKAPSCTHTHAWNSGWMTWRADSTWRNNSVYNLSSLRIVTIANERYDYSYGTYKSGKATGNIRYGSNVAKDETFIPGSSNISPQTSIEQIGWGNAVTFGFGSYCQISYGGATSGWYLSYCEHDTEISSPTTTYSSSGVQSKYKNSSDFAISTIPLNSTTTVSYNG